MLKIEKKKGSKIVRCLKVVRCWKN